MSRKKMAGTIAGITLAGTTIVGGAAMAVAATDSASPTPSPSGSTSGSTSGKGTGQANGQRPDQGPGGHAHTAASADETAKVKAAVKAKDSAVSVTSVEKDPDGSFDVHGTKAGNQVRIEVSADYKTVSDARTGGGPGGGPGASRDTPVTGAEATKVKSAVTAKNPSVTITDVRKDPDGSYDALGTKSGSPVFYDVSKDLATITERTGGPGGPGGHDHGAGGQPGAGTSGGTKSSNPTDANGTSSSAT